MKNGVKNSLPMFFKKLTVAAIYLIIFCSIVLLTFKAIEYCVNTTHLILALVLIPILALDLVFAIVFVTAWEELFKSEDED